MKFQSCCIEGLHIVELAKHEDDRGFFARSFCHEEFRQAGLNPNVVQCNMSFNSEAGTIRGLHYQRAPKAEVKFVRCVRGSIADVVVDLRESSPTYLEHMTIELSADNRKAFYIPEGFAHGFQTLENDTEVLYQVSEFYAPEHEAGARYDDPAFDITWPVAVTSISEKDAAWPYLEVKK